MVTIMGFALESGLSAVEAFARGNLELGAQGLSRLRLLPHPPSFLKMLPAWRRSGCEEIRHDKAYRCHLTAYGLVLAGGGECRFAGGSPHQTRGIQELEGDGSSILPG
jgi:hypothetical protein